MVIKPSSCADPVSMYEQLSRVELTGGRIETNTGGNIHKKNMITLYLSEDSF